MPSDSTPGLFEGAEIQRKPRLSDQVTQRMLDTILAKQLSPGDRLPSERELGEQFGVSRTVIREAVQALAAKGVIEVVSGRGLQVAAASASNVRESMGLFLHSSTLDYVKMSEVRKVLEVHIAGLAAERSTADDLRRLAEVHKKLSAALDPGTAPNVDEASHQDLEFHRAIAQATQNELFLVLMDSVVGGLLEVRRENLRVNGPQTLELHQLILERIVARDAEGARQAMADHLGNTEETWRSLHAADVVPAGSLG